MRGYKTCRECSWLCGRKSSIGIECMQPQNQAKWNEKDEIRIKHGWHASATRYKSPSGKACRKFQKFQRIGDVIVHEWNWG